MALHMNLMVNEMQIGYLEARRLAPEHVPMGSGDKVFQYEWRLNINGITVSSHEPLEHRYGDGAWALVNQVIEAAGRGKP